MIFDWLDYFCSLGIELVPNSSFVSLAFAWCQLEDTLKETQRGHVDSPSNSRPAL